MWNSQEHMEVYLAIPSMGAVVHTLNIRLFPEQLAYVINHGEDKVVFVDDSLVPLLAKVVSELTTVECFVIVGDGECDPSLLGDRRVERYSELLARESPDFDWPEIDERQASAMCYTSGTTGNPKGVAYSHRSSFLHSFAATTPNALNLSERDRILMIVPMFHANVWGIPYAAFLCGASLVMPGRFLQAEPVTRMVKEERVTFAGAVPTIWADIYRYGEEHEIDLSSLHSIICGGSAVPRSLMENFERKYGVRIIQAWGMTETSPLAAVAHPPARVEIGSPEEMDWRARTGRVVGGVELRIVDDAGNALPWDGDAVGEIEVKGPWITGSYYRDPRPRSSTRAGYGRAMSVRCRRRATSRSPTGPRTSSSRAGSGSARWSSRTCSWVIPTWSRRASSACPTPAGTSARWRVSYAGRAARSTRPASPRTSPGTWPSGRFPSAGASSTRFPRRRSVSSTRKCCGPVTKRVSSSLNNWIEQRRTGELAEAARGVEAAPAATVVLLRDGATGLEVLLARRSSKLAFHGGAWVFPGGRIDPEDYGDAPDDLPRAALRAAAREAKEEAGVDVDPDTLIHLSNWTTPEGSPKRFATWFFVGPVAGGAEMADGSEMDAIQWFRPAEALAARAAGEIELAPPQYVTLLDLSEVATVADAMAAIDAAVAIDYLPRFHFIEGGGALCIYPEDVAYDDLAKLDAPGPRHRLLLGGESWEYVRD